MDCVQRGYNARTFTGTGPTFRFAHRDEYRTLETTGTTDHSSTAWNNETWSGRPIVGRTIGSGDGDSAAPQSCRPRRVLVVHGLERSAVSCDRVFNLFCLYGNVTAVKISDGKRVLVELQDAEAAERCTSNLHTLRLGGTTELNVMYSKHSFIDDRGTTANISSADNSPAQKNYLTSGLNRFLKKGTGADHHPASPSKILHFYNAPLDLSAIKIHETVTEALGCPDAIRSVTILPKKLPGAKCSSGLIEMKNVELAAKTIFLLNHKTFESSRSRYPFTMKLCFSKWSEVRQCCTSSSDLLFVATARPSWTLHKTEHAVPTMKIPVVWTTRRVASGNIPWTLWQTRDLVTEAVDPGAGNPVEPTDWRSKSLAKQDHRCGIVHGPAAKNNRNHAPPL